MQGGNFLVIVVVICSFICTSIILLEVWNTRADYFENSYTPQTHTVTSTVTTTTSHTATVTATSTVTATITRTETETQTVTATKTATTTTTATATVTKTVTVTVTPTIVDYNVAPWISLVSKEYDPDDSEDPGFTTKHHCTRFGDLSGFCIYKNLCFNGDSLLFIDSSVKERSSVQKIHGGMGWDGRYRFSNKFPPGEIKYIPYSDTGLPGYMDVLPPSSFNYSNFQWTNQTIWFAKPQNPSLNPFFFAKDNALLWELQLYNKTVGNLLPSMDVVVMNRTDVPAGWARDMWNIIYKQPHTQVWVNSDVASFNFQQKPVCMKRAIVVSDKPRIFSGIETAEKFRRTVYGKLNMTYPVERGFKRPDGYIPKVLVTNRPGRTSRRIYNLEELEGLLTHYKLDYNIMTAFGVDTSLAAQVQHFQDIDLYIIVHGGGTINSIFLPAHSSLIELFPYGLKNPVYEHIACPLGLNYFSVRSWLKAPANETSTLWKPDFLEKCEDTSGQQHNDEVPVCNNHAKNACVWIPMDEMETALIEAFDAQGINIRKFATQRYIKTADFRRNDWYDPANVIKDLAKNLYNQSIIIN